MCADKVIRLALQWDIIAKSLFLRLELFLNVAQCDPRKLDMAAEQILPAGSKIAPKIRRKVRAKPDGDNDALGEVGWYLQRERVRRQETIIDIANKLNLDPVHLAALEHGDFAHLPLGTRVFDVLAIYADYLGYESAPLLAHFEDILRAHSRHFQTSSQTPETIVWLGDFKQRARNFARLATSPGMLGVIIAVVVGLISLYALGPLDSGLQRQAAQQNIVLPEGRNIVTSSVPKKVQGSAKAINRIPAPVQDLQKSARPLAPQAMKSVTTPKVQTLPLPATVPDPPQIQVPDIRIRERPLTDNGKVPAALPQMARDRLALLIARDIREAVKSAPKRVVGTERANQPQERKLQTVNTTEPGKTDPSGLATHIEYGSTAGDVRVVLKAREQVWIRVEDNSGNILFTQTLGTGDIYRVPNKQGLMLDARNAGALDYTVDGSAKGTLGNSGEIVIGLPLDISKIATRRN
jgi:cytoskeleton protein RodZ